MDHGIEELSTLKRYAKTLVCVWTGILCLSLFLFIQTKQNQMSTVALNLAVTSHAKDVIYRMWNASHGGVYVPITESTQPNPYLTVPGRDVTTTDGLRLTLINPAYMTRQVHSMGPDQAGIITHITSLKPIRPGNAPDAWEEKALRAIESENLKEYSATETINGVKHLRYIKPMITEERCLKCHAQQGYKVGDVRGGVAVAVPVPGLMGIYKVEVASVLVLHVVLWSLGLAAIVHGRRYLASQIGWRIGLHEQAEAAKLSAEAANHSKSEFLATMSHEIRTPLNGIMGMIQLTQSEPLSDSQRKYTKLALDSSRNLLSILNDILDLSRIESGKVEMTSNEFSPRKLLLSLSDIFKRELERKGLTFKLDIDPALPESIITDEGRLRQILFNLLGNAVKFTDSGMISMAAYVTAPHSAEKPPKLIVSVSDTGPGIPSSKLDAIFKPFTQLNGSSTRQHGGTGLGLAIVHRLASLLGGALCVESEAGHGCTMNVNIPIGIGVPSTETSPQAVDPARKPASLSILLVEDDPVNRLAAKGLLEILGYAVHTAASGEEALAAFQNRNFDLVIMDVQMPGMNGVEAARRIQNLPGGKGSVVPILAFTAHAMRGDRERLLRDGFDGYVSKPVEMDALRQAVDAALATAKAKSAT